MRGAFVHRIAALAISAASGLALGPACYDDSGPPEPPPTRPVTSCPVASLVDLYPDEWPPQPYGPKPAADACVSEKHDVIIVLGCPNAEDGAPSACQEKRADIAISLGDAGYGDRFITTGGAVHNAWVEADTLRDLLLARGVAPSAIWTDPLAEHTDENVYYATAIMNREGFTNALVVSDDRGHLMLTALCDVDCCVKLGRLTVFEYPIGDGDPVLAGHYALYPFTPEVADAECDHIEIPTKFMCANLPSRKACKGRISL